MWFKNLHIYRLSEPFTLSGAALDEKLAEYPARDCGALETFSYGWEKPLGRRGDQLIHEVGGSIMLCARKVVKVLPAGVINEFVKQRAEEIEDNEGRPVRRRERLEIKEDVIAELLPQAFVQSNLTYAYIDTKGGWLIVDASSEKKAEELVEKLRESLGSLPVRPLTTNESPLAELTSWLSGGEPAPNFTLLDECELRDFSDEGGVVRCRRQDLTSDEVRGHLDAGKQVVKLALAWNERLEFVLGEDLTVKRLRFSDEIQEEAADQGAEDEQARFDADFVIMSGELSAFLPALAEAFGGLEGEG
jgi:recombination associated protein RdgC